MSQYENILIQGLDRGAEKRKRQEKISSDFTKAYEKALKVLTIDKIDEQEFKDLYSEENVEKDLAYVAEMEEEFKKSNTPEEQRLKKLATIFEAIIHEQTEINNWLGENVETKKTSGYDDIENDVDLLAEFKQPKKLLTSHLALAVDVTFSSANIVDKMEEITQEINSGKLATIKYFKSDYLNIRDEKTNIPRVVIGVDGYNLDKIMTLWLNRKNQSLANHPVKFLLIKEILLQLESYKNYALKMKQPAAADNINKVLEIIEKIAKNENKRGLMDENISKVEEDKVYSMIKDYHQQLDQTS